jgi:hypothetical protein
MTPARTGPAPASKRRTRKAPAVPLSRKLALNQWLLGLFGVERFEELAAHLRDEKLEGLDDDNVHRLHRELVLHFPGLPELTEQVLLEYDQNIVRHTLRINERRVTRGEDPIVWKYFQYLALLFTEIYLDRYFRDSQALLLAMNARIAAMNASLEPPDQVEPFDEAGDARSQLNKLALWCATGSGKTLLMHMNVLQYRFYVEKHGRGRDLNRIILLTPNEGLSRQHLHEFEAAGIAAEIFDKDGRGLFSGRAVEILDIHKLREQSGEKTVAVDAFEGSNLVLVDEGHRGAAAGEEGKWMERRNALCERGFSFEYSATFGQAVKGNRTLSDLYARSILFDYSYRYFYGDGFGKDYQILNLDEDTQRAHRELYLTGCLLAFFQQQRLHREHEREFRPFQVERPLWIFVGGSVTKTLANRDATDIVEILQFLAGYAADRAESIGRIERVLGQGLVTSSGKNIFAGRFGYLSTAGQSAAGIFDETLATLFNAPGGGRLHVEDLKGAAGEIALRLGADNEPFGVINVGDDAKLVQLCEKAGMATGEREFATSLFDRISDEHSTINVLIGAKKFTEGWNSYRVSTMGLMNVGATEGAQIIQLFGRGVRLRGYEGSLKRSAKTVLPPGVVAPAHIRILETLSIFGIRADYMAQFRDFLEEEGLPADDPFEMVLPVIHSLGTQELKTIRLEKEINGVSTEFGNAFRKLGPIPTLEAPPEDLLKRPLVLDWYPKIQAMRSRGLAEDEGASRNETCLGPSHIAFVDIDAVFFELERFKAERGWFNLNLTRRGIEALLGDPSWYRLLIPEDELAFDSYDRVRVWQEIATALLKKHVERFYRHCKRAWEEPHLEYGVLTEDDPNLLPGATPGEGGYRVSIERSQEELIAKLIELKAMIEDGTIRTKSWEIPGLKAISFERHLYQPLLYVEHGGIEISPVALNKGEMQFVLDLKAFHAGNPAFLAGKELYLLRNRSRGRGVGFFEAGNFHPDFMLWLLAGGTQHVTFVDPKGILYLPFSDEKIRFFETIKGIERRLGDPSVVLDSFIVASTPSDTMRRQWGVDKAAMLARHILFQQEDRDTYIGAMLAGACT